MTSADPRGWRLGGGVTYGAMAAARLGVRVRALIAVDAVGASARELELLAGAGVEIELVRITHGPVMENRETAAGRVQLVAQASDRLWPRALPRDWMASPAVLLAPVADELPAGWARSVAHDAFVALAWQGLFRRLVPGSEMIHLPLRRRALVERADIALVSADDAAAGGSPLSVLLRRAGQQLVVSHGERGALHLQRHSGGLSGWLLPAIAAGQVVDATGAGDVFLAAWTAALMARRGAGSEERWPALAVAGVAASLSVQAGRLEELPTLADVCRRLRRPLSA